MAFWSKTQLFFLSSLCLDYSFPEAKSLAHTLGFSSRSMIQTPSRIMAVSTTCQHCFTQYYILANIKNRKKKTVQYRSVWLWWTVVGFVLEVINFVSDCLKIIQIYYNLCLIFVVLASISISNSNMVLIKLLPEILSVAMVWEICLPS